MDPAVSRAITEIGEDDWVAIKYPHAIYDEEEERWVLRRRGCRDSVHRVHLTPQERAHQRPVDRAPGQAAQPQDGAGRAGRTVLHLAPSRGLHRLRRVDAGSRGHPPRARHRREVIAEPKTGPLADMPQASSRPTGRGPSWPRSRSTSPAPPGPWPHGSTPRPPPRRSAPSSSPCPGGSPAPPARSESTSPSTGPGSTPGRRCSPPPAGHQPQRPDRQTSPSGRNQGPRRGKPGRPATSASPNQKTRAPVPIKRHQTADRWIEDEGRVAQGRAERRGGRQDVHQPGLQREPEHPGRDPEQHDWRHREHDRHRRCAQARDLGDQRSHVRVHGDHAAEPDRPGGERGSPAHALPPRRSRAGRRRTRRAAARRHPARPRACSTIGRNDSISTRTATSTVPGSSLNLPAGAPRRDRRVHAGTAHSADAAGSPSSTPRPSTRRAITPATGRRSRTVTRASSPRPTDAQ